MRGAVVLALLINVTVHGRDGLEKLKLPGYKMITGLVTDEAGHPLEGVSVGHSDAQREFDSTDGTGFFQVSTRAPLLVIRKAGFQSEVVWTAKEGAKTQITLHSIAPPKIEPCSQVPPCYGWELCFSPVPGVKTSKPGVDVDYKYRRYSVRVGKPFLGLFGGKRAGIAHASGALWSIGIPFDGLVWGSVSLREEAYEIAGRLILDTRGETAQNKHWRQLGMFGETASYEDVDASVAAQLDRVLDTVCIRPRLTVNGSR